MTVFYGKLVIFIRWCLSLRTTDFSNIFYTLSVTNKVQISKRKMLNSLSTVRKSLHLVDFNPPTPTPRTALCCSSKLPHKGKCCQHQEIIKCPSFLEQTLDIQHGMLAAINTLIRGGGSSECVSLCVRAHMSVYVTH